MTIDDLLKWMMENKARYGAEICVVSADSAVSQIVETDHLSVDEDGDVVIQL